jgi:hypothetical protein
LRCGSGAFSKRLSLLDVLNENPGAISGFRFVVLTESESSLPCRRRPGTSRHSPAQAEVTSLPYECAALAGEELDQAILAAWDIWF